MCWLCPTQGGGGSNTGAMHSKIHIDQKGNLKVKTLPL